ncbi:MAG: hypothetical protein V5A43_04050 [Haloarculaceae archaeon]
MTTPLKLLGIALAVVLVATGFVAAGYGPGAAPADGEGTTATADTVSGPTADADGDLNGTNSPWMTGDERLERLQDRFGLSDAQMEDIRAQVTAMIQNGADRDTIRTQVRTMLENYGVEDPTLGPPDAEHLGEGSRAGSGHQTGTAGHGPMAGHGSMAGNGHQGSADHGPQGAGTAGHGPMVGGGPHGPADGSCMN